MFLTCFLLSLLVHIYTVASGCGSANSAFGLYTDDYTVSQGKSDDLPKIKVAYRDSNGVPQITDEFSLSNANCGDMEGGWDYINAFDGITDPWDTIYVKATGTDGFLLGGVKYIGPNGDAIESKANFEYDESTDPAHCAKTEQNAFWIDRGHTGRCEFAAISLCGLNPEVFQLASETETINYCYNCDSLITVAPPVTCGGIGEGVDNNCAYNIWDVLDTITMQNGFQYGPDLNGGFVYIHPASETVNGFYEWDLTGINKLVFRATIGFSVEAHACGDGVNVNAYVDDILVYGPQSFSNAARDGVYEDIEIDIYDKNKLKIEVTSAGADFSCDQITVAGPSFCGDPGCPTVPDSFDWDALTTHGTNIPELKTAQEDIFSIPDGTLSLNVKIELEYQGAATGDEGDGPFGVTYVLDFEDFNAYSDHIYEPGTCQNRDADDFYAGTNIRPFNEWWEYSDDPNLPGNIGSLDTMAYPPQTNTFWTQSMSANDECDVIVYEGTFTWNDLVACAKTPGGASYVETTDGPVDITLSGVLFVNVVSPYAKAPKDASEGDGFYRVYQLLSKPFEIKISKSVYVLGAAGVNVLTMSIIAVFKENALKQPENDFRLVVLTESQNYLQLSAATTGYLFNAAEQGEGVITAGKFTWPTASVQAGGCLNNKAYICSQLWVIEANDLDCKLEAISFSGKYTLNFDTECRDGVYKEYCAGDIATGGSNPGWLADHPDIADGVALETQLTWRDEICDPKVFNIQFEATIGFYTSIDYKDVNGIPDGDGEPDGEGDHLFQVGKDNIYVEIDTDFASGNANVFDTKLTNVWICTFAPDYVVDYTFDAALHTGGCWDANRDGCENVDQTTCDADTFENPYFYHIYQGEAQPTPISLEGFNEIDTVTENTILRFYFTLPHRIARDTLYVQAQVEVTLESGARRVLLYNGIGGRGGGRRANKVANKMDHFIKGTGLTHDNYNPKNNPQPPQQPQEPINYPQPQPQAPLPNTNPNGFIVNLSSPWIIAIGSLLAVILTCNIIFMCYMNCNKQQRARVSFDSRRRNGYSSVKHIDSDVVNDSEINAINVVSDQSN